MNFDKLFDTNVGSDSLKEWRAAGKKAIGTVCCHVPEEIIHAAGMLPVRIRATGCKDSSEAETWMTSFSCSFAKSCLQHLIDGTYELDGVISSDGCLMAGRILDNWSHIDQKTDNRYYHELAAPRITKDISVEYYKNELKDIIKGLEEFAGVTITDEKLLASIDLYNETRALIKELYALRKEQYPVVSGTETLKIILASTSMPKEEFNELLRGFLDEAKKREPIKDYRIRTMMIGSALDEPRYMEVIEEKGGLVVTDALCFGSRYLWEPVVVEGDDILMSIANSYLKRPVCPRMIDLHDELYDFILNMAQEYKIDGIIYEKMQNCECWGGEGVYFNDKIKAAGIPMLTVEREQLMANEGQLAIRAEAFIEMIEQEV
ncbi:2-hydroxyacyl-CoA dehydratase family protein [Eubacteriaceae bacterium ES3]|nr:2-hydroxyacyl-CoA dehydratase family protein [Eubacteriaceae bacterium ES3]